MSDDIISKIQKLLNKAESTNHEAEADAFFAKAQQLMVQHAISEEQLAAEGGERTEEIGTLTVAVKEGQPATKARQAFLNTVAQANNCRSFIITGRSLMTVVGYKSDAEFVAMLYMSAELQCRSAVLRDIKEAKRAHEDTRWLYDDDKFRPGVWRRNYIEGYLRRVGDRITQRYVKVDTTAGVGTSIVLRDRGKTVEEWMAERFNLTEAKKRKRTAYDYSAQASGERSGDSADISGGRGHIGGHRKELGR